MKYIYGPVHSRRLGKSLGISLLPYKGCNFNCIYCQLGKTERLITERKEYANINDILDELISWLRSNADKARQLNYLTLSGLGEPTLNSKIGELIRKIKKTSSIPVAIITNASLLSKPLVRQELLEANLIVPSLDAASKDVFTKINRPAQGFKIEEIVAGLISLRREFKGKIWLEVMLVKGINDDLGHMQLLRQAIDKIRPDKVQLNSPVRSTAEDNVEAVDKNRLIEIKEILGSSCEVL